MIDFIWPIFRMLPHGPSPYRCATRLRGVLLQEPSCRAELFGAQRFYNGTVLHDKPAVDGWSYNLEHLWSTYGEWMVNGGFTIGKW